MFWRWKKIFFFLLYICYFGVLFMGKKSFIVTDKIEFVPDKKMEEVLWFNIRASAYVYNKTLEFNGYRENLVNEFGIGKKWKINRTYTQNIIKILKKQKAFLKKAESTCLEASTDRLIKAYNGYYSHRTGYPKFKSQKRNPVTSITLRNNEYMTKDGIKTSSGTMAMLIQLCGFLKSNLKVKLI